MSKPDDETMATTREIAKMIADLRAEAHDRIRLQVEAELAKLDEEDYDPTRGRGRGPKWM